MITITSDGPEWEIYSCGLRKVWGVCLFGWVLILGFIVLGVLL